jgi:hypothetical protein
MFIHNELCKQFDLDTIKVSLLIIPDIKTLNDFQTIILFLLKQLN